MKRKRLRQYTQSHLWDWHCITIFKSNSSLWTRSKQGKNLANLNFISVLSCIHITDIFYDTALILSIYMYYVRHFPKFLKQFVSEKYEFTSRPIYVKQDVIYPS
jgi:hypothetical protein